MAFDLNKSEESAPGSSQKKPASSRFDLSKKQPEQIILTESTAKSKTWVIGLIAGVLIVSGGIWYYSSETKVTDAVNMTSAKVLPSDPAAAVPLTQAKTQPEIVVMDTAVQVPPANKVTPVAEQNSAAAVQAASETRNTITTRKTADLNYQIAAAFGPGSSSLNKIDQALIKRIIINLTKNPAASIYVNGYASSEGPLEINQTISRARADTFKEYLVSKDIAESRIIASGKGIENPVASNKTNAGRKKNRRVEITIL